MSDQAPAETISVGLVDDHAVVRGALRALLTAQADLRVVGEAGDLAGAKELLAELSPQVLVLDVSLPDGMAVDSIAELKAMAPQTQIVLLTMDRDPSLAREGLERGALAYLFKDAAHLELIEAVRAVAGGGRYVPAAVSAGLAKRSEPAEEQPLSPRETDVLRLMALGHTNREIGELLELSVRTVETHRSHIQQKLGLSSRPELTRYAIDHRLLD